MPGRGRATLYFCLSYSSKNCFTVAGACVRWLGNRKGIEEQTTTWDKTVIDRQSDLKNWVVVLRRLVEDKRIRKTFAFANNH